MSVTKGATYESEQERVELKEFLNTERDHRSGEYLKLVPDLENRTLTIFRATGEPADRQCVSVVIDDVGFRYNGEFEPASFSLHWKEAETLLTWLTCLKWERTHTQKAVTWYQDCGRSMMEDEKTTIETLEFSYRSESENSNSVRLESPWQHTQHMMGNF